MRAYPLDGHVHGSVLPSSSIADLIETVGDRLFPAALFKTARSALTCEHLTAFAFASGSEPRIILAENAGPLPVARMIAGQYQSDYWRHDLANKIKLPDWGKRTAERWAVHTAASEIEHSDYRSSCYTSAGLDDRICLSETRNNRTIRINFYRRSGRPFSNEDASRIFNFGTVLLALVRSHDKTVAAQADIPGDRFQERLSVVAPTLTRREIDVCTAIIDGLTSEGIALKLNVGINTVLTYRKRAYARLGISSQNELIRLALN